MDPDEPNTLLCVFTGFRDNGTIADNMGIFSFGGIPGNKYNHNQGSGAHEIYDYSLCCIIPGDTSSHPIVIAVAWQGIVQVYRGYVFGGYVNPQLNLRSPLPIVAEGIYRIAGPVFTGAEFPDWMMVTADAITPMLHGVRRSGFVNTVFRIQNPRTAYPVAVMSYDSSHHAHLFTVDEANTLVVLHQTGVDEDGNATWAGSDKVRVIPEKGGVFVYSNGVGVPVRPDVGNVFIDPAPSDSPTVLFSDLNEAQPQVESQQPRPAAGSGAAMVPTRLMRQSPETGHWDYDPLKLSSDYLYKLPRWRTTISLRDANGAPVAQELVTLTSPDTVQVEFLGSFLSAGPDAVTVNTGYDGTFTLAIPAYGLTTPGLSMTCSGISAAEPYVIRPDRPVHDYLAGTGKLDHLPAFSGDTLKAASVNGQPLVPHSTWSGDFTPDHAVKMTQTIISVGGDTYQEAAPEGISGVIVHNLAADGHFTYREFAATRELVEQAGEVARHPDYGGVFSDLAEFAGDIWEGLKSAAATVAQVAVDTVNKTVNLVYRIGSTLIDLGWIAIKSLEEAFHVVATFFSSLGTKLANFVQWLKDLLDWGPIWDTKKALVSGVGGLITPVQGALEWAQDEVDQQLETIFATLRSKADESFSTFGSYAANNHLTFGSAAKITPPPPPGESTFPDTPQALSSPKASLVQDKYNAYAQHGQHPAFASPLSPGAADSFQEFTNALTGAAEEFSDLAVALGTWIAENIGFSKEDLDNASLPAFMTQMHDFVISIINLLERFVSAVEGLIMDGFSALRTLLTQPIDFAGLNTFYRWIQVMAGEKNPAPLTLLEILALIVAVPATIAYRLFNGTGSEPFPGGVLPAPASPSSAEAGPGPASPGEASTWPKGVALANDATMCLRFANSSVSAVTSGIVDVMAVLRAVTAGDEENAKNNMEADIQKRDDYQWGSKTWKEWDNKVKEERSIFDKAKSVLEALEKGEMIIGTAHTALATFNLTICSWPGKPKIPGYGQVMTWQEWMSSKSRLKVTTNSFEMASWLVGNIPILLDAFLLGSRLAPAKLLDWWEPFGKIVVSIVGATRIALEMVAWSTDMAASELTTEQAALGFIGVLAELPEVTAFTTTEWLLKPYPVIGLVQPTIDVIGWIFGTIGTVGQMSFIADKKPA